jgi:hypothetical protein
MASAYPRVRNAVAVFVSQPGSIRIVGMQFLLVRLSFCLSQVLSSVHYGWLMCSIRRYRFYVKHHAAINDVRDTLLRAITTLYIVRPDPSGDYLGQCYHHATLDDRHYA